MSTLTGRWRADHQPVASSPLPAVITWHATKEAAEAEAELQGRTNGGRSVAWEWPGEYIETPGEEAARLVREMLVARFGWLGVVA